MESKQKYGFRCAGDDFERYVGKIQGEGGVIYCRCKGCRDGDSMLTKQARGVTEREL